MTTPTFNVSVKRYVRGLESESIEINLTGIPADIDDAALDMISEKAGRVAQSLGVHLPHIPAPSPQLSAPKPRPIAALPVGDPSVFDDDDEGQPIAAVVAPEPPTPTLTAEYDPAADTLVLKPETMRKSGAWSENPAAGHPEFCRCGDCYDNFHDDADPYGECVEGCFCPDCLKARGAKPSEVSRPEAEIEAAPNAPVGGVTTVPAVAPAVATPTTEIKTCNTCGKTKADNPALIFCHRPDKSWTCMPCFDAEGRRQKAPIAPKATGASITPNPEPAKAATGDSPAGESQEEPALFSVPCHRCGYAVFGGGVEIAGEKYCHDCVREKDKEAKAVQVDAAEVPDVDPIPADSEVSTTIDVFGVQVGIPPIEWAREKITKTGGESDGGQCKALNTVLGEFGYKGGDRHYATLAIIQQWHDLRAALDSLSDITRAEAHLALEFLDAAKDNTEAQIKLHDAASQLKGQIPMFLAKVAS